MFEIRDVLQIASTVFAGSSVFFAIRTYTRNRLTQQITLIRSSLSDGIRAVDDLDRVMSEGAATQIAYSIVDKLKVIFGVSISQEVLASHLEDNKNQNIIIHCIHLGIEENNVTKNLISLNKSLQDLTIQLRALAPSHSRVVGSSADIMYSIVHMPFATRSLMQIFSSKTRHGLFDGVRGASTIELAYADIADTIIGTISVTVQRRLQDIFDEAQKVFVAVVEPLMAMNDDSLIKVFAIDRAIKVSALTEASTLDNIRTIDYYLDNSRPLFSSETRDVLIASSAKLKVLMRKSD